MHISANFVFGCILVFFIVAYYFGVTVTLTSDFGHLKLCAEHISILYDIEIPFWDTYLGREMLHTVLGHCDLDLWPQNLIKSYPQHFSHIFLWHQYQIFVWMHQNNRDCRVPFLGNCDLDLWPQLYKNFVPSMSSIL